MGRNSDARERIVTTALRLVQARNYNSVSVEDLCNEAHINKGSFYYFFTSKRELLLEALEAHWQITRNEVFEPAFSAEIPVLERITKAFELAYQRHKTLQIEVGYVLGCPFGNVAAELSTQDEQVRQKIQEVFGQVCGYFEKALNEAMTEGQLDKNINVSLTTQALLAYFEGAILVAKTQNEAELISHLGKFASRLVAI